MYKYFSRPFGKNFCEKNVAIPSRKHFIVGHAGPSLASLAGMAIIVGTREINRLEKMGPRPGFSENGNRETVCFQVLSLEAFF